MASYTTFVEKYEISDHHDYAWSYILGWCAIVFSLLAAKYSMASFMKENFDKRSLDDMNNMHTFGVIGYSMKDDFSALPPYTATPSAPMQYPASMVPPPYIIAPPAYSP